MKEDLHNIDKLFKSSIEEHEEMPSTDVWNAIDKNLDKDKVIDITRRYLTLRKVAIVLLVLLATISFYEISTWNAANKVVKNIKADNNDNSNLPHHNNGNSKTYKKPGTVINKTKDNTAPSGSAGNQYTQTDNAGKDQNNANASSLLNTPGLVGEVTTKDKTTVKISQHTETLEKNLGTKNKTLITRANTDAARQGLPAHTITISKDNQVDAELAVKEKATLSRSDIRPAFTEFSQITPPALIDPYNSFSSAAFSKRLPIFIADNKANNPIKLASQKRYRFAVTPFFSRDFVSNRLIMDRIGNHERDRDEIKRTESASSAFTAGVLTEYALNKHWSIQSGLNISKTLINIKPKIIYARPDDLGNVKFRFNYSAGYSFLSLKTGMPPAAGDSLRAFESSNTTQYIGIPLAIKYNFREGKFSFNVVAGISANILTNQKLKTVIWNGNNNEQSILNEIKGLKRSYFSGMLGLGIDYSISKNIALSIIPNARIALTSVNKDAPVRCYPQSLGLGAGIRFQL